MNNSGKRRLLWGLALLTAGSWATADDLLVDYEIQEHEAHAKYLREFKDVLSALVCSLQVGANDVVLDESQLGGLKLIIGIDSAAPGKSVVFHRAPKPEHLRNEMHFNMGVPPQETHIVRLELIYKQDAPVGLLASFGQPGPTPGTGMDYQFSWKRNPFSQDFWQPVFEKDEPPLIKYHLVDAFLAFPKDGEVVSVSGTTYHGLSYTFSCK